MAQNTYPKTSGKPDRIQLIPRNFNKLIEDQGCRVRITPAIVCPRRSGRDIEVDSTNHDLNCPLCRNQIIDLDDLAIEDWAFIQSVKLDKVFDISARFDVKDAFMSVKNDFRMSYWYKVEIIDFGSQFNELVKRGSGDTDRTRYEPKDPMDGSYYSLIDHDGNRFEEGTDYVADAKAIRWLTSNRPKTGKLFSILYPVLPTFRVLEMMHENRYYYDSEKSPVKTPVQMPQQVHIRWDFMAWSAGSDISGENS